MGGNYYEGGEGFEGTLLRGRARNLVDWLKSLGEGIESQPGPNVIESIVMTGVNRLAERPGQELDSGFAEELRRSVDAAFPTSDEEVVLVAQKLIRDWTMSPPTEPNQQEALLAESVGGLPDQTSRYRAVLNAVIEAAVNNARHMVGLNRSVGEPRPDEYDFLDKIEVGERRVTLRQAAVTLQVPGVAGYRVERGNMVAVRPGRSGDEIPIPLVDLVPGGDFVMLPGDPSWADVWKKVRRFFGGDYQPSAGMIYFVPRYDVGTWRKGRGVETAFIVVDDPRKAIGMIQDEAIRVVREIREMKQPLLPPIRPANILDTKTIINPGLPEPMPQAPTAGRAEEVDPIEIHRQERAAKEDKQRERMVKKQLRKETKDRRKAISRIKDERMRLATELCDVIEEASRKRAMNPATNRPYERSSLGKQYQHLIDRQRELDRELDQLRGYER